MNGDGSVPPEPTSRRVAHRPSRSRRPSPWLRVGWVLVGLGLLSSGWSRWIASGTGSTFGGLDLADVLRSNVFIPDVGDVVAGVIYLVVASGGVALVTSVVDRTWVVAARGVGCAAGAAMFALLGLSGALPWRLWGIGASAAAISYLAGVALTTVQILRIVRPGGVGTSRHDVS